MEDKENIYIKNLIKISKYAGGRSDLVQAGGGNSSVKTEGGQMLIKASGFSMSEVEHSSGYCTVGISEIPGFVHSLAEDHSSDRKTREKAAAEVLSKAAQQSAYRPSIESFLHALSPGKYTLHTHPLSLNMILNRNDWESLTDRIYGADSVKVPYATPGVELALNLYREMRKDKKKSVMFLQNHGLIVTAESPEEVISLTEETVKKAEEFLGLDLSAYRAATEVAELYNSLSGDNSIAMLVTDEILNRAGRDLFMAKPFCPDSMVFCGVHAVTIEHAHDKEPLTRYRDQYSDLPSVILYKNNIYITAKNVRKAKEKEDVLKFHIMALSHSRENIHFLEDEELAYLGSWEAEKYRKKL